MKRFLLVCLILGVTTVQSQDVHDFITNIPVERIVKVVYTNWRGETAQRAIIPIAIHWGKTEWHPQLQWLLKVWDIERQAYRDYALKDIKEWR